VPRVSTAYVKNIIRRGFAELIDPEPDSVGRNRIWDHFESRCAYCGVALAKERREGRIDHAVSASESGYNGLANRVLACGPCNDHEKRDEHWEAFLIRKNPDSGTYNQRRQRIVEWMGKNDQVELSAELRAAVTEAAEEVAALFDEKVGEVKRLARRQSKT
jgi:hypothetical protein